MRHTITNLGVTLQLSKHTYVSQLPTTGQEFTLTYSSIKKLALPVNVENRPRTNHRHCIHFQCQSNQTFASMLISLGQCWQPVASTNTFYESRMLSQNTLSSHQWRTKKQKLWQKPFFLNGFVNSASSANSH